MNYIEIFPPQSGPNGETRTLVPRPDKWTREDVFKTFSTFFGKELGGNTLSFVLKSGQHPANENPGEPETMEEGFYIVNPKTYRVMGWMSEGILDLIKSEKFVYGGTIKPWIPS